MNFDLTSIKINYLKITYNDKDSFTHCVKSAVRNITDYEILASTKLNENLNIKTPQEVELSIACDNGLYKAKTELTRVIKEEPYLLFSVRTPKNTEFQQKREFFRVKIKEDANIIFEETKEITQLSVITYDLSANGVRIELDKKYDFPEKVKIILYLPQRIVETKAKFIRTDNEDNIIKASFQLINTPQSDLDYISQVCLKKQIEERKKNLL